MLHHYSELYFYASFTNIAYLWNMEFWVGTGANFHLLKQLALCAMLNGEKELASKYFRLLKQSLFYKTWAEEHEQYNNDHGLLMKHPVYSLIKYYMPEEDFVAPINFPLPAYYMFLQESFIKNGERCILARLYLKNLDQFMHVMQVVSKKKELPACMQEALLIYAAGHNDPTILQKFKINKRQQEIVSRFLTEYERYKNNPPLAREKLEKYKGTYCYFYFCTKLH